MKAKQLLKNLYNLSHDVIWEIEANREIEGKSFIKPSDLKRITELIDNISNDVEKAIDQTREETIKEVLKIIRDNYKPLQSEEVDNLYAILTIMVDNLIN